MAKLSLLNEAGAQDVKGAVEFGYPSAERPNPTVLPLGSYTHPRTQNNLMAGMNLDLLSPGEIERIKRTQKAIFKNKNLPDRYWAARRMHPAAMERSYRTYDLDKVDGVKPVRATAQPAVKGQSVNPPKGTVDSFRPKQWAVPEPKVTPPADTVPVPDVVQDRGGIDQTREFPQQNIQQAQRQTQTKPQPSQQSVASQDQEFYEPVRPQPQIPMSVPDNTPNAIGDEEDGIHDIDSAPELKSDNTTTTVGINNEPPNEPLEDELDKLFNSEE